jgi:hypothetical protein
VYADHEGAPDSQTVRDALHEALLHRDGEIRQHDIAAKHDIEQAFRHAGAQILLREFHRAERAAHAKRIVARLERLGQKVRRKLFQAAATIAAGSCAFQERRLQIGCDDAHVELRKRSLQAQLP